MGGHRASRLRTFCSGVGLNSIGLALLGMSAAAGAQIYVQAYDVSGFALASQNDTSVAGIGAYSTTYDDFTLSSDATITGLRFTGIYFNPGGVGTTTSFQVQFYNDDIGQPGSSVFSTTILGNGGEVCDTGPANPVCAYGVSLNFTALAGTPYWLSIVSNSNSCAAMGLGRRHRRRRQRLPALLQGGHPRKHRLGLLAIHGGSARALVLGSHAVGLPSPRDRAPARRARRYTGLMR